MGKRKREEHDEDKTSMKATPFKMVVEDTPEEDTGFGSRNTGRVRKKSAKVKEMEEFEMEEKKHNRRGSNKAAKETVQASPISPTPIPAPIPTPKKIKIKQEPVEPATPVPPVKKVSEKKSAKSKVSLSPVSVSPAMQSPVGTTPVTSPPVQISIIPPLPPTKIKQESELKSSPVSDESTKLKIISVTPKKQKSKGESPVLTGNVMLNVQKTPGSGSKKVVTGKTDILPIEELSEVSPSTIVPKKEPVDPSENSESVIKLLLNSPAQATSPVMSGSVTQNTSPPVTSPSSETSSGVKKALKQKLNKKGKTKHDSTDGSKATLKSSSKKQLQKMMKESQQISSSVPADTPLKTLAQTTSPDIGIKIKVEPSLQMDTSQMSINTDLSPTFDDGEKSASEKKKRKIKKLKEKEKIITTTIGGNVPSSVSAEGPELKPLLLVMNTVPPVDDDSSDYEGLVPDLDTGPKLVIVDKSGEPKKLKKKFGKKGGSLNGSADVMSKKPIEKAAKAVTAKAKMQKQKKTMDLNADAMKKKRATAYTLWCNSNRNRIVEESRGIDFAEISRRLAEMWHNIPPKEKMAWKSKAKRMTVRMKRGISMIKTGKAQSTHLGAKGKNAEGVGAVPGSTQRGRQAAHSKAQRLSGGEDLSLSPVKGFGIEPVDVAAHLKLLGESLSIIGMRLQEHKGLMAVQGSFSVLLDSMLCALGPLMCLTSQVPEVDGCPEEVHANTLDSIAYVMPGL